MIAMGVTCCSLAGGVVMIAIVVIHVASWQIRMLMITMMTIVLSVSGLYFANPKSTYFSLGKIQNDQVGQRDVFVPIIYMAVGLENRR